jgi:arsenate reductase
MAEGYLKHFSGSLAIVKSAGIETHGVNARAVVIMLEDGIDIRNHTSNHVDEYSGIDFDFIITVCDNAKERCPVLPSSAKNFHHDFPDPAKATGTEEEVLSKFRLTRNQIKDYCRDFVEKYVISNP